MNIDLVQRLQRATAVLTDRWRLIVCAIFIVVMVPLKLVSVADAAIDPHAGYVLPHTDGSSIRRTEAKVGLVLGAGITEDGRPYKELQGRLDAAADAIDRGDLEKLVLSGDNRFAHYDEPTAMARYLVERRGIDPAQLQPDFAGRSTYESCERAAKVFQLDKVVIFSAGSHLPRAIFLCRHFGVVAYGVAAGDEANNSWRREPVARAKALINAYAVGEQTILGSTIPIAD